MLECACYLKTISLSLSLCQSFNEVYFGLYYLICFSPSVCHSCMCFVLCPCVFVNVCVCCDVYCVVFRSCGPPHTKLRYWSSKNQQGTETQNGTRLSVKPSQSFGLLSSVNLLWPHTHSHTHASVSFLTSPNSSGSALLFLTNRRRHWKRLTNQTGFCFWHHV